VSGADRDDLDSGPAAADRGGPGGSTGETDRRAAGEVAGRAHPGRPRGGEGGADGPEAAWTAGATKGALLVVGDVVTDVVARHRGPLASGTDTVAAVRTVPGGAGANVACWAAHEGCADVRLLGRVGGDAAAWHERELAASGVRPLLVTDPEAPTGTVICLVDTGASAERTFLTDSGASLRLAPDDWSPALLDGVARLHLSGYLFFSGPSRALVSVALESTRARGVPVSLDPASAGFLTELGVDRFLELSEGVDVLLPSRDEAYLLTGLPDPADAAAELSRRFPLVVAKQGDGGALVARSGTVRAHVPALPATPHDTTGAGDAFTGAFLAALLTGAGAEEAAKAGCAAGARAVERVGGRPPSGSRPRRGEETRAR
jgi:sugar/nucleoside kinase (ribokinase family)